MQVTQTGLEGLVVIEPDVYADERGHFFEGYSVAAYAKVGIDESFVQMNQSFSQAGVLRGLHFQAPPFAQSKLVRCLRGRLYDVAVDIRKSSATYGQFFGLELSQENKKILYVPAGFAHGFCAVTDCELMYLCGLSGYEKSAEGGLRYDDPTLSIVWPLQGQPRVNERDSSWPLLSNFTSPFA